MNNLKVSKPICTSLHNLSNCESATLQRFPQNYRQSSVRGIKGEVGPLLIYISGNPAVRLSSNMSYFAGHHLNLPFYPV